MPLGLDVSDASTPEGVIDASTPEGVIDASTPEGVIDGDDGAGECHVEVQTMDAVGDVSSPPRPVVVFAADKRNGDLYLLDSTWTRVPGNAQSISGSSSSDLWVIDPQGFAFEVMSGVWVPHALPADQRGLDIAAAGINNAYLVTTDFYLRTWHGSWTPEQGLAVRIDTDTDGSDLTGGIWCVNGEGTVYELILGFGWVSRSGILGQDIGVGNNVVYATDADNKVYNWTNGTWAQVPGAATRIDVDPLGHAWALDPSGQVIERMNDGSWTIHEGVLARDLAAVLR